jgi:hypothetical protein
MHTAFLHRQTHLFHYLHISRFFGCRNYFQWFLFATADKFDSTSARAVLIIFYFSINSLPLKLPSNDLIIYVILPHKQGHSLTHVVAKVNHPNNSRILSVNVVQSTINIIEEKSGIVHSFL